MPKISNFQSHGQDENPVGLVVYFELVVCECFNAESAEYVKMTSHFCGKNHLDDYFSRLDPLILREP